MKKRKQKKCRSCKGKFTPVNSLQIVCSPSCAIAITKINAIKKDNKKALKMKRESKLLDRRHQFKLTKAVVQKWVNHIRDKNLPCISCSTTGDTIYCGGHFKTAGGNPERALWTPNIHRQCNFYCNCNLSGNIEGNKTTHGYKKGIINRYNEEYFDYIDSHREFNKLSCDDLVLIRKGYNKLIREDDCNDEHLRDLVVK